MRCWKLYKTNRFTHPGDYIVRRPSQVRCDGWCGIYAIKRNTMIGACVACPVLNLRVKVMSWPNQRHIHPQLLLYATWSKHRHESRKVRSGLTLHILVCCRGAWPELHAKSCFHSKETLNCCNTNRHLEWSRCLQCRALREPIELLR